MQQRFFQRYTTKKILGTRLAGPFRMPPLPKFSISSRYTSLNSDRLQYQVFPKVPCIPERPYLKGQFYLQQFHFAEDTHLTWSFESIEKRRSLMTAIHETSEMTDS